MTDHHIKAITSFEELDKIRVLWEKNQWHPNADFEFFKLIVFSRSEIISPCVFVVLDREGSPLSLLAGRIEQAKMSIRLGYATLAKIPVRRLVLIEGAFMGERTENIWAQLLTFLDRFLIRSGLDYAYFEQIKIASSYHGKAIEVYGNSRFKPSHELSEHWLMSLPETWEEFLKTRSRKHRYWLKRLENTLNKEFAGKWTIRRYTSSGEANEFLVAAEAVARTTYHRSLGVGFQTSDETSKRIELEARRGQLRGYILLIDEEPKAFWYCTTYLKRLYLCSTGYLPAFRSYEVGTVLLMKVFQEHCGTAIDMVDFGLGEAGYKQRFGSEHFTEASHILFAHSARGRWLNIAHRLMRIVTKTAKGILDRLNITQQFKTVWRRKMEGSAGVLQREDRNKTTSPDTEAPSKAEDSHVS